MNRSTFFSIILVCCLVFTAVGCFQLPEVPSDSGNTGSGIGADLRISGIRLGSSYVVVKGDFEARDGETLAFKRIIPLESNQGFASAVWSNLTPGTIDLVIETYVGLNLCQSLNQPFNEIGGTGLTQFNIILPEATNDCGLVEGDEDMDLEEMEEVETDEAEVEAEQEEEIQRTKKTVEAAYSATAPQVDGTLGFGEYDAAQAVEWSNPTMGQTSKLWVLYDDSHVYFGLLLSSFGYSDLQENSVTLLIDYQGMGLSAFSFKIIQPATGNSPETHCIIVPDGLEECFRLEQGWQSSEAVAATGEWNDSWLAELSIPFARLGIVKGVSKKLALSVVQIDRDNRMAWSDDTVNESVPTGWDWLESENAWNPVTNPVDGDEDEIELDEEEIAEQEVDEELDSPDEEPEADEIEADSDPDPELEPETDAEEEAEAEEDVVISCVRNSVECDPQGQYFIARKCNAAGNGYDWEDLCDYNHAYIAGHNPQCGTAICVPGSGASAGCYYQFNNSFPPPSCTVGDFCYDTGVCVQRDGWEVCEAPERSCDDGNECTEDTCNSGASDWASACESTAYRQGQACEPENECVVESYCDNGACSGTFLPNCCPGHPDMVQVNDQFCFDMYENVLSDSPDCSTGTLYGQTYPGDTPDFHAFFPPDGANVTTELYACSIQGVKPSAWLTQAQAARACTNQGKRLCSLNEWSNGCGNSHIYPYGDTYTPLRCADRSHMLMGSGTRATGLPVEDNGTYYYCSWDPTGTDDIQPYDASGNVSEWIETDTQEDKHCGGSYIYIDGGGQQNLSCQSCKTAETTGYFTDTVGFRCCISVQ